MQKTVQSVLIAIVVLALAAAGAYAYVVRPTKAPSQNAGSMEQPVPSAAGAYQIVPARSTASFSLQEDLRGERITVTGVTSDVSGEVNADRNNLAAASIGTIRINARTFVTDSEQRNNAIRRLILKTEDDANEFIEFKPSSITGLPASVEIGQSFPLEVTGDLTVSGTTKSVKFTGTAAFVSDNELSGSAQTLMHYPDFGISVPNLPFLANVEQDVTLKLEFVATR